eukprot:CAMPEP_0204313696 /NCGR_PEP_ID=MMETSP0469-20131031/3760_1 /ASSEMBLY_ACC=CAM_ASM_000384 /TAXON_ID=2969 /ORGANISM="Oxyrrhis marina" /LENGTH=147 /DNA_ID=CAMNT_0051294043 /DNA_START=341 /DNA_END=785 /DNA_ORIENTATION=+
MVHSVFGPEIGKYYLPVHNVKSRARCIQLPKGQCECTACARERRRKIKVRRLSTNKPPRRLTAMLNAAIADCIAAAHSGLSGLQASKEFSLRRVFTGWSGPGRTAKTPPSKSSSLRELLSESLTTPASELEESLRVSGSTRLGSSNA